MAHVLIVVERGQVRDVYATDARVVPIVAYLDDGTLEPEEPRWTPADVRTLVSRHKLHGIY